MYYLSGLAKARILLFSTPHFVVAAAVAVADADDAAASVAAEVDGADAAETGAAASENESGAVETAVQLEKCALLDCLDRTAADPPRQKKRSSS
ncbi:hypothetical protein ACFX13_032638 [Malus domestica]